VTELATDYMERTLSLRASLGMRLHLGMCSSCRAYVNQLRKTVALLRGHQLPPPSPETREQIIRQATQGADDGDAGTRQ